VSELTDRIRRELWKPLNASSAELSTGHARNAQLWQRQGEAATAPNGQGKGPSVFFNSEDQ